MALYTGKGDAGTTKLFDSPKGKRLSKSADIFEALGTLDELNSVLGWCKVACDDELVVGKVGCASLLHNVQDHLFTIQAEVAGAEKYIPKAHVKTLEHIIESIEAALPEITTFLVPGGSELSTRFDIARSIARRAERRVVIVHEGKGRDIQEATLAYLNRLSSLLYALTRLVNHQNDTRERPPAYQG